MRMLGSEAAKKLRLLTIGKSDGLAIGQKCSGMAGLLLLARNGLTRRLTEAIGNWQHLWRKRDRGLRRGDTEEVFSHLYTKPY